MVLLSASIFLIKKRKLWLRLLGKFCLRIKIHLYTVLVFFLRKTSACWEVTALLMINSRGKHDIGPVTAWLVWFRERSRPFLHCLFLKGIWHGNICHLGVLAFFTFGLVWGTTIMLSKQVWNSSSFIIKILYFSKKPQKNPPKPKTPHTFKKP